MIWYMISVIVIALDQITKLVIKQFGIRRENPRHRNFCTSPTTPIPVRRGCCPTLPSFDRVFGLMALALVLSSPVFITNV